MTEAGTMRMAPLIAGLWLALAGGAITEVPQGKPAAPQAKSAVPNAKPPQAKPTVPQGQAAASQGKPAAPQAKSAKPPKATSPMQVVIVRDSRTGCEPDC